MSAEEDIRLEEFTFWRPAQRGWMRTPSGPTLIPHTSPCTSSSLARKMSLSSPKTGPCRGSLLSGLAPRLRGLDQPQQGGPDDRRAEETLFLSGRIRV